MLVAGSARANLSRSIRYRIASERANVRELTFARGFEEVRTRLRNAASAVDDCEARLHDSLTGKWQRAQRRLDMAAQALSPAELRRRAHAHRARFEALCNSRNTAVLVAMENARRKFGVAAAALDAMSPLKVLERGYAIAQDSTGAIVREANAVTAGDAVRLRLWKGELDCRVEETRDS